MLSIQGWVLGATGLLGASFAETPRAAYPPSGAGVWAGPTSLAPSRKGQNYRVSTEYGWRVSVREELFHQSLAATEQGLAILRGQLREISETVPAEALKALRQVHLWLSPEYPGTPPRAEYHPDAAWLRSHGRDPSMAKGIEFTNVRIMTLEADRMPVFVLHELAHAFHDRMRRADRDRIDAAYRAAKAGGRYDRVERWHGTGKKVTWESAYAITNAAEYFAEGTEAFFGRNDFFPFTRAELKKHDPDLFRLLEQLWQSHAEAAGEGDGGG